MPPSLTSKGGSSETGYAEGTVIRVEAEHARITLKHGAIEGLGMPAMTMVFRVSDPAVLTQVRVGDSVGFTAIRTDNMFTVTRLQKR